MKKTLSLWLICLTVLFILGPTAPRKGRDLTTPTNPWVAIGTITAASAHGDATLGVAERDFAGADALTQTISLDPMPDRYNAIEVRFILTTDDEDVDIDIWVCRGNNEMVRVCTLDVICGNQDYTNSTNHFAQTAGISNEVWITDVQNISNSDDTIARVWFDMSGYDRVLFHGYGTFDEDCIVEVSGW